LCTLKASYLLFYYNLFSSVRSVHSCAYIVHIATVMWILASVSSYLCIFLYCLPISNNWAPIPKPHCPIVLQLPVFLVLGVCNLGTDIAIIAVPITLFSDLKLGKIEKIGLAMVFAVGGVSLAATVARLAVVAPELRDDAFNWGTVNSFIILSNVESSSGAIALCLPAVRKFFLRVVSATSQKLKGQSSVHRGVSDEHLMFKRELQLAKQAARRGNEVPLTTIASVPLETTLNSGE